MSATTTQLPTVGQIFGQVAAMLKTQLAAALAEEVKTIVPIFSSFLTWVIANPADAKNPVTLLPQLALLQAELIASQTSATNTDITSLATALNTSLTNLAAAV